MALPDDVAPATVDELAEIRKLHATEDDWMPEDGYPIRGGLSAYGVIEILLATLADRDAADRIGEGVAGERSDR